jgi:hypothetical protein
MGCSIMPNSVRVASAHLHGLMAYLLAMPKISLACFGSLAAISKARAVANAG